MSKAITARKMFPVKIFKLIPGVFLAFVMLFAGAGAGVQAQTLPAGTRIQDAAQCGNISNKNNVDDCQRCVAGKGMWVTGQGCTASPFAPRAVTAPNAVAPNAVAPNAATLNPGTRVQDSAQCGNISNKNNVDDCQRCIAVKGTWVTGQGCVGASAAPGAVTAPNAAALTAVAPNAATLTPGTRVQDSAQCGNISNKNNVDDCQRCVAGKGTWVTGQGCVAAPGAVTAPNAAAPTAVAPNAATLTPGTRVQDSAQCGNISNKNNVDDCQRCIAAKGTWVTGQGCVGASAAPGAVTAPNAAALKAATLTPGTRVQDSAQCGNISNKNNVDDCQRCVASKGVWVTGSGCSK